MTDRFPARYEKVAVLGRGGGGQVWAVRDRITGATLALKALAEGASEREMQALVREAVALSGLEGLGVPRVLRFGRLPVSRTPYMVRELVEGQSLESLLGSESADPIVCLHAVARAADQLTGLHRAGLLHGDVKPANIIVTSVGSATLVDLGLAAPWREGGTRPEGLTPRYAAPELFAGMPLTVRGEVHALGATLAEVLDGCGPRLESACAAELRRVTARATHEEPASRYPSVDELASALRHAARIPVPSGPLAADAVWPVLGVDAAANLLLSQIAALRPGASLAIEGAPGSGRTVLLRRIAWTLGVEGSDVAWVEPQGSVPLLEALDMELSAFERERGAVVLVDDADALSVAAIERLARACAAGSRVALVAGPDQAHRVAASVERFAMPSLEADAAESLVRRAVPSLPDALVRHILARSGGRPGMLRAVVHGIGNHPAVSPADIDRLVLPEGGMRPSATPPSTVGQLELLLDQGRFEEAASVLAEMRGGDELAVGLARARLALARGESAEAIQTLAGIRQLAFSRGPTAVRRWSLQAARAHLGLGSYAEASEAARAAIGEGLCEGEPWLSISLEAQACLGLVDSYCGRHEQAEQTLRRAASMAPSCADRRVEAVVLGSLAIALQRADKLSDARGAFEATLRAAEAASDAGAVANARLNLAGLAYLEGDLAGAIQHLEAAIDMGRRAGRGSTTRQALLNLALLDIYLGRFARARSGVAALADQREQLSPGQRAQQLGLEAQLAAATGEVDRAQRLYESCAQAYDALGRHLDAAESRLEGTLLAARSPGADPVALSRVIEQATAALGDSPAHRALAGLARGAIAALQRDEQRAREAYDEALGTARTAGQREWVWRTLQARSRLLAEMGQGLAARRDSEEALAVLEEIAVKLPRDLREVYWDEPRRRSLRQSHLGTLASAKAQSVQLDGSRAPAPLRASPLLAYSGISSTLAALPLEERLARLLEINRELAREPQLERLLERVTDHAITLLGAERGFVILVRNGELVVHTSRDRKGEDSHAHFSRSIAEQVVASGEPVVTLSALDDERMAGYLSVHQLAVQSVACVPIRTPDGRAAGALYLETRLRPGALFHAELPTLVAFADQAAIAIENAHLVSENRMRADELARANEELLKARKRLEELLGQRTAQLESTRRDLRSTRAVLHSHFGYHGLVGTSERMRRVYALVDRVKDMDVPVLITGESGTGKEVVARAIHTAGGRGKRPFTGINCGAIPEHLLESELFGHVRGAFTGADRDRKGLFRETEGGTILLDEIGEMPHKMQAGLLRVLQEHLVRPVGGTREEPVSVRVVTATHRDLQRLVADGAFREDLYYRLHVVEVSIPPLRERADDIPMLIDHFLQIFAARYRRERKTVSRDALRLLCDCPWPGNVRQLENVLLNAWVMSDRNELVSADFESSSLRRGSAHGAPVPPSGSPASASGPPSSARSARPAPLDETYEDHEANEKERILQALHACNWNRVKAAELVDIPRRTFYRRLKKHGIQ